MCPGAELLQKHLQLRGEKAGEFVLHAGDVRAVMELRLACVPVACSGGASQVGPGLGAGSSSRAVDAVRRLLAALGVQLGAHCEAIDAGDTVEGTPWQSQFMLDLLCADRRACVARALAAWRALLELCLLVLVVIYFMQYAVGARSLPVLWGRLRRLHRPCAAICTCLSKSEGVCGCADSALPFMPLVAVPRAR